MTGTSWTSAFFLLALGLITVQEVAGDQGSCPEGERARPHDPSANSPDEPSIYDELTHDEIAKVTTFIESTGRFDLSNEEPAVGRPFIYLMEILPPVKSQVLEYLDRGGPRPKRYARVVIYRPDLSPPVIEEYSVGPLPNPTEMELIVIPGRKNPIPYQTRSPVGDIPQFDAFIRMQMVALDPLMLDVTGYTYNNCTAQCLSWIFGIPGDYSDSHTVIANFLRQVEGSFVHPVGLELQIDADSVDYHEWTIMLVWFRGQTYNSVQELLEAWGPTSKNRQEEITKKVVYTDDEELHSSLNFRGEPRPTKPLRGPTSYYPDGRRYEVDGHHVKWQGWSFDFTLPTITGMTLYDVRFLEDRIIYELSPQEIAVLYSGRSPWGHYTAYHDSVVQMGRESYELFPGVDCPKIADFFSFTHYLNGVPFLFKNSACLFELDRGIPLRRHYHSDLKGSYEFYHGMPDNVLVLRTMITAWNYDYVIDYIFHQQGGIEVVSTLSGYILSTFYTGTDSEPFGFETSPDSLGNIHHHLLNFKVDMDIQGTSNRFETLDIKAESEENRYADGRIQQYKFDRHLRETEEEAAYKFNFDTPKYLLFYNEEAKNKFGNPKAYRIVPVDMSKLLMPPEWALGNAFSWAKYQVAVTKHKMEEYFSSSMYNTMNQVDPVINFQDFIDDNERIVDEDLVAWITLGTVHIPHTEDIPIVVTQGVQLTFHILPYNYFDEDMSLSSRDNIRVTPGKDGAHAYKYSGVDVDEVGCLPKTAAVKGGVKSGVGNLGLLGWLIVVCVIAAIASR